MALAHAQTQSDANDAHLAALTQSQSSGRCRASSSGIDEHTCCGCVAASGEDFALLLCAAEGVYVAAVPWRGRRPDLPHCLRTNQLATC